MRVDPVLECDAAYVSYRSTRRFGSLDALRAISILAVIWHHGPGVLATTGLLQQGFRGVDLFFAISGFLITTLLLREADSRGAISLRDFYARRALRIFPLYFTVLAVYVGLVWVSGSSPRNREFFANLPYFVTYTSNWFVGGVPGVIFSFSWSLATEEQFYCTWPWCERLLSRRAAVLAIVTLIVVSLLAQADLLAPVVRNGSVAAIGLRSVSFPLCLGVLLAHAAHAPASFRVLYSLAGRLWASPVAFVALFLSLQLRTPVLVTDTLMAVVVLACVLREDHLLAPIFRSPLVVRIGMVSYGMYLFHGLVYNVLQVGERGISAVRGFTQTVPGFVAAAVLTLLAADLSFRWYESRFLRMKHHFKTPNAERAA